MMASPSKCIAPMTQPREALVVEDLHKSFGALEVLKGISMTAP